MKLIDSLKYLLKWIWVFIVIFVVVTGIGLGIALVKNKQTVTETTFTVFMDDNKELTEEQITKEIDRQVYLWSNPSFYDKIIDEIEKGSAKNVFGRKVDANPELAKNLRENPAYLGQNLHFVNNNKGGSIQVSIEGGSQTEKNIMYAVANAMDKSFAEPVLSLKFYLEPEVNTTPVDFSAKLAVLLSAVVGVLLGLLGCYIAQQISPKLLSAGQVKEYCDIPLIGECYLDTKEGDDARK